MQNMSENLLKVKNYFEKYNIEEIIADLLNSLGHAMSDQPVVYMIKFLANLCKPEDLKENGISVVGPYPITNLAIVLPTFDKTSTNLFKKHLTPQNFLAVKNNKTTRYASLRNMLQFAIENEKHSVGVFAPDADSYNIFSPLFDPILAELNSTAPDTSFSYKEEASGSELFKPFERIAAEECKFINRVYLKVKRNVSSFGFNYFMKGKEREEVNFKLQSAIGQANEKISKFSDLSTPTAETKKVLEEKFHLGKYVTSQLKGIRYKDWPENRCFALSDDKNLCVVTNREDHFELRCSKNETSDLKNDLSQALDLLDAVDKRVKFAFDSKLGYITTNPKYVGTGTKLVVRLKIPPEKIQTFQKNLALRDTTISFINVKEINSVEGIWQVYSKRCFCVTDKNLFKSFEKTLLQLLSGVSDRVIPDIDNEKVIKTKNGDTEEQILTTKFVSDAESYDKFENAVKKVRTEKLGTEIKRESKDFELTGITKEHIKLPEIIRGNFKIVRGSYFILRRNLKAFDFINHLSEKDAQKINELVQKVASGLPDEYTGDLITPDKQEYSQLFEELVEELALDSDFEKNSAKTAQHHSLKYARGTGIYHSENKKLKILVNYQDHLTLVMRIDGGEIMKALKEFNELIALNDQEFGAYAQNNTFGYLTANPLHAGTGLEIIFSLHLENKEALAGKHDLDNIFIHGHKTEIYYRLINFTAKDLLKYTEIISKNINDEKKRKLERLIQTGSIWTVKESTLKELGSLKADRNVLDCFTLSLDLIVPYFSAFDIFKPVYRDFIEYNLGVQKLKGLKDPQLHTKFETQKLKTQIAVSIHFEFGRIFKGYSLNSELSHAELTKFSNLLCNSLQEGEYSLTNEPYSKITENPANHGPFDDYTADNLREAQIYTVSGKSYAIWLKLRDHICIKGTVPVAAFKGTVIEVCAILDKLKDSGLLPLYNEELGYYAERAKNLVSNLTVQITLRLRSEYNKSFVEDLSKLGYKVQSKAKETGDGNSELSVTIEGPALFNEQISFINSVVDLINSQDLASPIGKHDENKKPKESEDLIK